jgi:hypothetical protein
LIRQALTLLSHHLDETADDANDQELIDDLLVKNTVDDPFPIVENYLTGQSNFIQSDAERARGEALWVAMSWLVPWEHARQARLLRVLFERNHDNDLQNWIREHKNDLGLLPQLGPYHYGFLSHFRWLCIARAALLKLALRSYQADNGKPADNLDELVPKYLPSIPLDPYDGEPFRYRLSQGEEIEWPADSGAILGAGMSGGEAPPPAPHTRKIPAGQGVLWSVGEDKVGNGGHRQSGSLTGQAAAGEDMIFLVPLPPQAK